MKHYFIKLTTLTIQLEHLCWHGMTQAVNHPDRPLALVSLHSGGSEIREWNRRAAALFQVPGKKEDRVSALLVLDNILSGGARLAGVLLRLPVK